MIGKRVKLARSAAGLSLRALEQKIGNRVTAQAIGKYERDEDVPSSGVLIALAQALEVSVDYLAGDPLMALEAVEFRNGQFASKKEQAQVRAIVLHFVERYATVEDILGLPSAHWERPAGSPYRVRRLLDAENAAMRVRESWNLGLDPIPNLIELLEERGVKVVVVESNAKIDGLAAFVPRRGKDPVRAIVLRRRMQGETQRFSLARELGHTVLNAEGHDQLREQAAQRFAGALLMPADVVRENVGKHRTSIGWGELFALKRLFGAGVRAISDRCADLGIFPPALSQRLHQELSRLGYRKRSEDEPYPLNPEEPRRFERLCYRALAEEAISEAKVAELLGITVHQLNERMEMPEPVSAC